MAYEGDVHMDANFDSNTMGEEGCESASNILTLLRKLKETIETSPQVVARPLMSTVCISKRG